LNYPQKLQYFKILSHKGMVLEEIGKERKPKNILERL